METSSGPRAAPARPARCAPGGGAVRSAERAAVPLSAMPEAPGVAPTQSGDKNPFASIPVFWIRLQRNEEINELKPTPRRNSLRSLDPGLSRTSFCLSAEDYQVFCGFHRLCL